MGGLVHGQGPIVVCSDALVQASGAGPRAHTQAARRSAQVSSTGSGSGRPAARAVARGRWSSGEVRLRVPGVRRPPPAAGGHGLLGRSGEPALVHRLSGPGARARDPGAGGRHGEGGPCRPHPAGRGSHPPGRPPPDRHAPAEPGPAPPARAASRADAPGAGLRARSPQPATPPTPPTPPTPRAYGGRAGAVRSAAIMLGWPTT